MSDDNLLATNHPRRATLLALVVGVLFGALAVGFLVLVAVDVVGRLA